MKNIPTAEEFFEQGGTYPELAIEFAKLHVQAALQAASEKAETRLNTNYSLDSDNWDYSVDSSSILNSYPLDKIK